MNNLYYNVIQDYVLGIKTQLKDDLLLVLIIGSSASPMVIENWSDIDVILVLKEYKFDLINKIKKISNSYSVKIGTTIYSKQEFVNKKIDPKTYYHLYLLQNNKIELQYRNEELILPKVSFKEIKATHKLYLYWRLHIYKRNFLYESLNKEQYKNIYKTTYLIMKAKLILDGFMPRNYEETFSMFSNQYKFDYFDYLKFINDYLKDCDDYKKVYDYAKSFLLKIMELV